MRGQQRVSTTEMSPPADALTVAPPADAPTAAPPAGAPGRDLVPAEAPAAEPASGAAVKAPKVPKVPKVRKRKSQGRTTRVVLRRLDPWSVLKLSIVYYLALFVVILVAGVLLWAGASAVGVVENIENFMVDIGFEDFRFIPSKLLGGVALGGLVLVVAGTFANVLMTALFNLMGDVVGGLRLTLQEDVAPAPSPKDEGRPTV